MTLDQKNSLRVKVRLTLLGQWLLILCVALVVGVAGMDVKELSGILVASTTGMTAGLGLDYYSKPN